MGSYVGQPDDLPQGGSGSGNMGGGLVGLLQLGGALYQGYQDRKTAERNTDATIAANKAEAELAYQRQVDMWNKMNMYNTPEAQMARFAAGGLNPHLIYGQGNSGNASSTPAYQPPSIQYRYAAGNAGSAIAALLPTLMSVGTWMQDMKLKETEIERRQADVNLKGVSIDKAQQMVDYLSSMNPMLLKRMANDLDLFGYQRNIQYEYMNQAQMKTSDMLAQLRMKYGDDYVQSRGEYTGARIGGTAMVDYLKRDAEARLKQAQASWTDYGITNPQALIQMVMSGVMGMAGMQLRAPRVSSHPRNRSTSDRLRNLKKSWEK